MDREPDATDVAREAWKALAELGEQFRDAFEKHWETTQYQIDKEFGKQLAKHPELYAEVKRGYRSFRKGLDKLAAELGVK